MADQLNMNGLSLNGMDHANGMAGRSTYIPPHMRNSTTVGPPPSGQPGLSASAWGNAA